MIETDRLILRPYVLADYEPYLAMSVDPLIVRDPGIQPMSAEDAWHRVLRYAGHWSLLGYGAFAVIEKATGEYIGETGLSDFHRGMGSDFDGYGEASWYFAARSHGHGLAFEAASAAHAWYASEIGPGRTVCMISPGNGRSLRLAERLGYRAVRAAHYKDNAVVIFERAAEAA